MNFKKVLKIIPSLPKSIFFNIKYFGIKRGLKLPVLISRHVLLNKTKGKIIINVPLKTGLIRIGFGYVPIFDKYKSRTVWNVNGVIIFNGSCNIGHGSKIGVGGKLVLGNNFGITAESMILCDKYISFGDNVLISWKTQILDTDFHKIYLDSVIINPDKQIIIGNNVWIGSFVNILKGTIIKDNSIIGAGSVLSKEFIEGNCIIAGNPGKIIKKNVRWEK